MALVAALAIAIVALPACSKKEEATSSVPTAAPTAATTPAAAQLDVYSQVAQQTKGFTAGSLMSANTVYVLFDPQCPHCGHLWQVAQPLLKRTKFVWVPINMLGPKSLPQGAALLTAANPVEAMTAHETSLLAGTGGMSAPSSIPDDIEQAIKANTKVFNAVKGESVPMIIAKHAGTGTVITRFGSKDTADLAQFLGIEAP
ncbi:MAG: thiol:disulfide interchange protein [Burkholderiales bacterium PBB3]|nr:MAG: thiol:disulfide interchange protein [Burkholderiales bacterium PBB3]